MNGKGSDFSGGEVPILDAIGVFLGKAIEDARPSDGAPSALRNGVGCAAPSAVAV